jgi:Ni/Fe-hydrogenase subunit HybB-like protein
MEAFSANFAGNKYEEYMMHNRMFGPYAMGYWALIACNIAIPQLLWFKGVRRCAPALFVLSLIINVGMWLERFEIVVTSLHRDYMPSAWGMYYPTKWDWATYVGTIGLFLTLFLLFIRALPLISMFEIRHLLHESEHDNSGAHSK